MKKNFIFAVVLAVISLGLIITAIVFNVLDKKELCMYFGMGASGTAFISVLFGINSWKEK